MVYAESGINWFFPYRVEFEDDDIVILQELPREHRFENRNGPKPKIDCWITIVRGRDVIARINGLDKLCEIIPE